MTMKWDTGYKRCSKPPSGRSAPSRVSDAQALLGRDDVQFVDLRDVRELQREG
jgi:hypothetical protein